MSTESKCPACGGTLYCEYVDIGVGMQQVTPYECGDCGWQQPGPKEIAMECLARRILHLAQLPHDPLDGPRDLAEVLSDPVIRQEYLSLVNLLEDE